MTSPQITPGPWQMFDRRPNINDFEVSCGDSDVNGGLIIASCVGPDMEANAKAIAALPLMTEALQAMLAEFGNEFARNPACEQAKAALRTAGVVE